MSTQAMKKTQQAVVEAKDVVAGYIPGVNILNGCSLVAYPGEMIGIIGPNGAGKSTLLKAMFGLVKVHSGSVMLGDRDITNVRTNRLVEMGVGFVPQTNNVFPTLTIEENLRMGLFMRPKKAGERLAALRRVRAKDLLIGDPAYTHRAHCLERRTGVVRVRERRDARQQPFGDARASRIEQRFG